MCKHTYRGSRSDKRLNQQPVEYVGCQCIQRGTGCPENEVSLSDFSTAMPWNKPRPLVSKFLNKVINYYLKIFLLDDLLRFWLEYSEPKFNVVYFSCTCIMYINVNTEFLNKVEHACSSLNNVAQINIYERKQFIYILCNKFVLRVL